MRLLSFGLDLQPGVCPMVVELLCVNTQMLSVLAYFLIKFSSLSLRCVLSDHETNVKNHTQHNIYCLVVFLCRLITDVNSWIFGKLRLQYPSQPSKSTEAKTLARWYQLLKGIS